MNIYSKIRKANRPDRKWTPAERESYRVRKLIELHQELERETRAWLREPIKKQIAWWESRDWATPGGGDA